MIQSSLDQLFSELHQYSPNSTLPLQSAEDWLKALRSALDHTKNRSTQLQQKLAEVETQYNPKAKATEVVAPRTPSPVTPPSGAEPTIPSSPATQQKKKVFINDYFRPTAPSTPTPITPLPTTSQKKQELQPITDEDTQEKTSAQVDTTTTTVVETAKLSGASSEQKEATAVTQKRLNRLKQKKNVISSDSEEEMILIKEAVTPISSTKATSASSTSKKRRRTDGHLSDDDFDPNNTTNESLSDSDSEEVEPIDLDGSLESSPSKPLTSPSPAVPSTTTVAVVDTLATKNSITHPLTEVIVPTVVTSTPAIKKQTRGRPKKVRAEVPSEPKVLAVPASSVMVKSEEEVTEDERSGGMPDDDSSTPATKRKRRRNRVTPSSSSAKKQKMSYTSSFVGAQNLPHVDVNNLDLLHEDMMNREKPKTMIQQFWHYIDKYYFKPVVSKHISPEYFFPFPEDDSTDPLYTIPPLGLDDNIKMSRSLAASVTRANGYDGSDEYSFLDNEGDVQMGGDDSSRDNSIFDVHKASRAFARRHNMALGSESQDVSFSTDIAERLLSSLVSENSLISIPDFMAASSSRTPQSPEAKARASRFGKTVRTPVAAQDDTELSKYEQLLERSLLGKADWTKLESSNREAIRKLFPIPECDTDHPMIDFDTKSSDYDMVSRETLSQNIFDELSHIGVECTRNEYKGSVNELPIQDDEVSAELRMLQTQLREHRQKIKSIFSDIQREAMKHEEEEINAIQMRLQYVNELNHYKQNAPARDD